jgi:hypothetical protein
MVNIMPLVSSFPSCRIVWLVTVILTTCWCDVRADEKIPLFSLDGKRADYTQVDWMLPGQPQQTGRDSAAFIGSHGGDAEFFDGGIDDVRIYRSCLTPAEIHRLSQGETDVANEELAGWWPLDGNFSNKSQIAGSQPPQADGELPQFADGRHGQAAVFDGKDDTLRAETYDGLKPAADAITISAWIRPHATPDEWMEIYRKEDGDSRQLLAIGKTDTYGLWFGVGIHRYLEVGGKIDPALLRDGRWHHVAASCDGQFIRLYHNGQQIATSPTGRTQQAPSVELGDDRPADEMRIVFLGNTLIHRDQDFGYLETELTRLHPDRDVIFRNLGWPADTVSGSARVEFGPGEEAEGGWQRPDQDAGE